MLRQLKFLFGVFVIFCTITSFKSEKSTLKSDGIWISLIDNNGVSIEYMQNPSDGCQCYFLKISNQDVIKKQLIFGISGQLADPNCKSLYSNITQFQNRNIIINEGETLIGTFDLTALVIPYSDINLPIEEIIQNLTISNYPN